MKSGIKIRSKMIKQTYHGKYNNQIDGIAIFISNKVGFTAKNFTRDKEHKYHNDKRISSWRINTVYVSNKSSLRDMNYK